MYTGEKIWLVVVMNQRQLNILTESEEYKSIERGEALREYYSRARWDTLGWYSTREEAQTAIIENHADLWEHGNDYALTYPLGPGVYAYANPDDEVWFKWNTEQGCYEPIETPDHKHVVMTF